MAGLAFMRGASWLPYSFSCGTFCAEVRCPFSSVKSNSSLNRTAYGSRLAWPVRLISVLVVSNHMRNPPTFIASNRSSRNVLRCAKFLAVHLRQVAVIAVFFLSRFVEAVQTFVRRALCTGLVRAPFLAIGSNSSLNPDLPTGKPVSLAVRLWYNHRPLAAKKSSVHSQNTRRKHMSVASENPSLEDVSTEEVLSKNNLAPTIEDKDIYKTVLDTRNLEIALFWQRSNYFLVLNSALAVGFFNLKSQEYAFLLAAFGLITSLLWFRVALGGKYWQSRWEQRLSVIESKIAPSLNLFSASWETIQSDVAASLSNNKPQGWFKKWLERQVLKKHSVSYNMTLLSLCFVIGWVLLDVIWIWRGGSLVG